MKLSKLQKFILIQCKDSRQNKVLRKDFLEYYKGLKKKPTCEDQQNIITKSLMRLIRKDLLVGFGEITKEKIYVSRVRLTRMGRKEVRRLLDRQQKLPLKVRGRNKGMIVNKVNKRVNKS